MIIIINAGSSSIKFAVYKPSDSPEKILDGQINRIGLPDPTFKFHKINPEEKQSMCLAVTAYSGVINFLLNWLKTQIDFKLIKAIGHRLVHGMHYTKPMQLSGEILNELKTLIGFDPDHLPTEIQLIECFKTEFPEIPQFACFDTDFHKNMPVVAKLLPIPRRFSNKGIHRYGFHGLSYQYLMRQLEIHAGNESANGRVILAHLGSGASLAAVYRGGSLDTSMGFTPASGIPMSSRSGDLDPGICTYIMESERLSPLQFSAIVNHESGLLGISGTSADMMDLLKQESSDLRSAEAVGIFCYQAKKCIGSFAAVLGGLDSLVFSGGIGENAPVIRERICAELTFLGIELDEQANIRNAHIISSTNSKTVVRVIPTDEAWMIAWIISGMIHVY